MNVIIVFFSWLPLALSAPLVLEGQDRQESLFEKMDDIQRGYRVYRQEKVLAIRTCLVNMEFLLNVFCHS